MGADNWASCPKCLKTWVGARDVALAAVKKKYGKIPADEYEALLLNAKEIEPEEKPTTLREDYSLGMDNEGTFEVAYKCQCTKCGFSYSFDRTEKATD